MCLVSRSANLKLCDWNQSLFPWHLLQLQNQGISEPAGTSYRWTEAKLPGSVSGFSIVTAKVRACPHLFVESSHAKRDYLQCSHTTQTLMQVLGKFCLSTYYMEQIFPLKLLRNVIAETMHLLSNVTPHVKNNWWLEDFPGQRAASWRWCDFTQGLYPPGNLPDLLHQLWWVPIQDIQTLRRLSRMVFLHWG